MPRIKVTVVVAKSGAVKEVHQLVDLYQQDEKRAILSRKSFGLIELGG